MLVVRLVDQLVGLPFDNPIQYANLLVVPGVRPHHPTDLDVIPLGHLRPDLLEVPLPPEEREVVAPDQDPDAGLLVLECRRRSTSTLVGFVLQVRGVDAAGRIPSNHRRSRPTPPPTSFGSVMYAKSSSSTSPFK